MPRGQPIELPPPTAGTNRAVVEPQVSPEYVWKSRNMVSRYGEFRTRPGLLRSLDTPIGSRIRGGVVFTAQGGQQHTIAATNHRIFDIVAGSAIDITGAALVGSAEGQARFAVWSVAPFLLAPGDPPPPPPHMQGTRVIMVNNVDRPRAWDGQRPFFIDMALGPPSGPGSLGIGPRTARDVDIALDRVILFNVVDETNLLRQSSRIRFSAFNDPTQWNPSQVIDLTDTGDEGVAVRTLTRSTVIFYKDKSIWIGTGQAAILPLAIDILQPDVPGPVNPSAVVGARGAQFYLGRDQRIRRVSTLGVEEASGPLDRELQTRIDLTRQERIWGVYRPLDETVWFFFASDANTPDQAVSLDAVTGALHLHTYAVRLSAGWSGPDEFGVTWDDLVGFTWNTVAEVYPTWDSFGGKRAVEVIGSDTGQIYRTLYGVGDDRRQIDMAWEYPPRLVAGPKRKAEFDAIESAFEKVTTTEAVAPEVFAVRGAKVHVDVGVTDTLAEPNGPRYTEVGVHDTSLTTEQMLSSAGRPAIRGRFMNWRYRCKDVIPVKFKGAAAYINPEERES